MKPMARKFRKIENQQQQQIVDLDPSKMEIFKGSGLEHRAVGLKEIKDTTVNLSIPRDSIRNDQAKLKKI